jgi:hypothetical protein
VQIVAHHLQVGTDIAGGQSVLAILAVSWPTGASSPPLHVPSHRRPVMGACVMIRWRDRPGWQRAGCQDGG